MSREGSSVALGGAPSEGNPVVGCRGRDIAAMCRRGDVTTRYREDDVAIANVGKEAAAPLVVGEGTPPPCVEEGDIATKCGEKRCCCHRCGEGSHGHCLV